MERREVWVTARFVCKDGCADEMKTHLHTLVQSVRREHGCLFDDCLQDAADPNAFTFVEHWATDDDFQGHVNGAPAAKWSAEAGHLIAVPVEISHFESIWE